MNISDYIVYLWLVPVALQVVLPLVVLAGWAVSRVPLLLGRESRNHVNPSPVCAG